MKIAVISDTHIPKTGEGLPEKLCEALKKVDLILHAGDLTELSVLEELKTFAPVRAVCGNMDNRDIQGTLPQKDIIEVGKFKIGLIHGYGTPFGLQERIGKEFINTGVHAIVYGHSHKSTNEVKNGVLFFNPGSPTDKVFARINTYGLIKVNDSIKGEIIKL